MLSCKELAQQHASDYIDERLTAGQRRQVRLHLFLCSHCRRFIKKLKITQQLLKQAESLSDRISLHENSVKTRASELRLAYQAWVCSDKDAAQDNEENAS